MTIIADFADKNRFFVLNGTAPVGFVECFAPGEWKAFDADGEFKGWHRTKRAAVAAI